MYRRKTSAGHISAASTPIGHSLVFSPQPLFDEVLGSEFLLKRFFFSFLGIVLGKRSLFPALFDFGFQSGAKECSFLQKTHKCIT